jgi:hypothetical protein
LLALFDQFGCVGGAPLYDYLASAPGADAHLVELAVPTQKWARSQRLARDEG